MKNNFDFLRLLFAIFVVITHSYELSGSTENDLMSVVTNGQTSFSYIGVRGFFIISGFLIFQSLTRSQSLIHFYKKRISRIFPALSVVLILTVVLGIFPYEHNFASYLNNKTAWTYVPNNILLFRLQFSIHGIFDNNPYPSIINGSLWTIPYEITFYALLSLLFFFNDRNKKIILGISVALFFIGRYFFYERSATYGFSIIWGRYFLDLGLYFFFGSYLSALKFDNSHALTLIFGLSLLFFMALIALQAFEIAQYICLPLTVISFGVLSLRFINSIRTTFGDASYGIYIFSFPIQQTLVYYFKLSHLPLIFFTLTLSTIAGYISWHYVEKRFLVNKISEPSIDTH